MTTSKTWREEALGILNEHLLKIGGYAAGKDNPDTCVGCDWRASTLNMIESEREFNEHLLKVLVPIIGCGLLEQAATNAESIPALTDEHRAALDEAASWCRIEAGVLRNKGKIIAS